MAMLPLEDILGNLAPIMTEREKLNKEIINATKTVEESVQIDAAMGAVEQSATQQVLEERAIAEQKGAEITRTAAQNLGINPDDPNNVISARTEQHRAYTETANAYRENALAKRNVEFWRDGPIDWLTSQISASFDDVDAERFEQRAGEIQKDLNNMRNVFTDSAVMNKMVAETITAKEGTAIAQVQMIESERKYQAMLQQVPTAHIATLMAMKDANTDTMNNMIRLYDLQSQIEEREDMKAFRAAQLADRNKEIKSDEQAVAAINSAREALGQPRITKEIYQANKAQFVPYLESGLLAQAGITAWGNTSGETLVKRFSLGDRTSEMKRYQGLIQGARDAVAQSGKDPDKSPEAVAAEIDNILKDSKTKDGTKHGAMYEWNRNMEKDSHGVANPYRIPGPTTILGFAREQQKTLFAQEVLKPFMDAGVEDVSMEALAAKVAEVSRTKKLPLPELTAGMSSYVKAGILTNNATRGYATFGLKNQKNYIINGVDWSDRVSAHDRIFREQISVINKLKIQQPLAHKNIFAYLPTAQETLIKPYEESLKQGASPSFPFTR